MTHDVNATSISIAFKFTVLYNTYSKVSPSSTVSASTTALSDMANDVPNFGTNVRVPMLARLMGTFDGAVKALTATADANKAAAA